MKESNNINENDERLPVAQSVWVPDEPDDNNNNIESGLLRTEFISSNSDNKHSIEASTKNTSSSNNNNNKYDDDYNNNGIWSSVGGSNGYTMSTGEGVNQNYWGRFNDTHAEVIPDHDDNYDGIPAATTARLDDRQIRLAFIRKVYTILSAQLLLTFAMCALITLNSTIRGFALGPGFGLYYFNLVMMFVLVCALHAYKRTYPHNYILLTAFTICTSYLVGTVTAIYAEAGAADLVIEAVFITATVFIVLTIFTLQSKWDFSFMGAGLGICLWIMILFGLFSIIFGIQTGFVYALLGSILFSLYIIYDTYMIAERLDPEDYIVAAIELYLDLINLFLYILQMLGESNRR